ncbi:MAG TPA: hypothetical protein VF986_00885 [Actinomycetota bacterium]
MKAQWRVGVGVLAAVALGVVPGLGLAARSSELSGSRPEDSARVLEIYVRSPVLVRAGERVRLPVQVVCATAHGDPCASRITLASRSGDTGAWQRTGASGVPSLQFDLSAPAARALGSKKNGTVSFFVRASGPGGRNESLPSGGESSPLQFFVARELPVVRAPSIPFGRTRAGRTALFLPWGSGTGRAGLELGRESATLGPSSFDVDRAGRIYLADPLQDRVAEFSHARLVRQTAVSIGARADIALTDKGAVFVLDQDRTGVTIRRIDARGRLGRAASAGVGIIGQVRTVGEQGLADLLPQDSWTSVSADRSGATAATGFTAGRPITGGRQLLRVISEDFLRLGVVADGRVVDPIEVRFGHSLGELALAEPDGSNGYWAVVHVRRDKPAADQYQVVHISGGRVVQTFAVGDRRFADTPPLARFRLGGDGFLYQLVTSSAGMRIVRFDLGRES